VKNDICNHSLEKISRIFAGADQAAQDLHRDTRDLATADTRHHRLPAPTQGDQTIRNGFWEQRSTDKLFLNFTEKSVGQMFQDLLRRIKKLKNKNKGYHEKCLCFRIKLENKYWLFYVNLQYL
jgi:hypothetical protein